MFKAILLSGGIDSIALSYWKKPEIAITINYGQIPAQSEFAASESVCKILDIRHIQIQVDCSELGSGDLSNSRALTIAPSTEWWPYRNQMLVTLASMKAVALGVDELMVGSVISDGFHKDGTNEFYNLINLLMIYQEGNLSVTAPATSMTSVELVLKSGIPPEILLYAHSCHRNNIPCGHCRGCYKYIEVIKKLHNVGWDKS
jgi:7-cyano-7-deazaguanine synthase